MDAHLARVKAQGRDEDWLIILTTDHGGTLYLLSLSYTAEFLVLCLTVDVANVRFHFLFFVMSRQLAHLLFNVREK